MTEKNTITKIPPEETATLEFALPEISGVLCIDKPAGMTSHDVVNRVRHLYGTKRVGHTGTLDPIATGLLTVLVGRATKAAEYLQSDEKEYLAELQLGVTTDTEDATGRILTRSNRLPTAQKVAEVAQSFLGPMDQIPPMYSAIKVGGEKLMNLARRQILVERQPRPITIFKLDVQTVNESIGRYVLSVHCSKGTYIRSLCRDLGEALGCGGTMNALRRLKSGNFSLINAYTLEELEQLSMRARHRILLPTEFLFHELPYIQLPPFFETLARQGNEIYLKKINRGKDTTLSEGTRLRLMGSDGRFFALGEVQAFDDGLAVKPLKQFQLKKTPIKRETKKEPKKEE